MNRKGASGALLAVGVAGTGWLYLVALLDDDFLLIAILERAAWLASFMTVLAIGVVLALPPADRRAGPPVIAATLLLDIVLLTVVLRQAAMWTVPIVVVVAILAGSPAFLLVTATQRQLLALRSLVVVGLSIVLFLAAYVIVTVDMPWF
jgi:hypothetical protein